MGVDLGKYDPSGFDRGASIWKEALWVAIRFLVFEHCPLRIYGIRRFLLRLFGARVGRGVVIKPNVRITFPWRLTIGDNSWIGEDVWILNLAEVRIGANVCISQRAFICTGNHDYNSPTFDLIVEPVVIEDGAWIGACAFVAPGVRVGSHAVLTAGSVATDDLEPKGVYQGNPAKLVRERKIGLQQETIGG